MHDGFGRSKHPYLFKRTPREAVNIAPEYAHQKRLYTRGERFKRFLLKNPRKDEILVTVRTHEVVSTPLQETQLQRSHGWGVRVLSLLELGSMLTVPSLTHENAY